MSENANENNYAKGNQVVEALRKNNFESTFFKTREAAIKYLTSQIPQKASIGFGGSMTLNELGLTSLFDEEDFEILNHNKPNLTPEEKLAIRRRQLVCDVFLTSSNAITMDGKLVNKDGVGNRVAAMIFGPEKVFVLAGINKIVNSFDDAERRIKEIAAPQNNKRLNLPNPCIKAGKCLDCTSRTRICNVTTILHKKPSLSNIHVIIIGEDLGY